MARKKNPVSVDISLERVEKIYKERYGSDNWKQLLDRMPDRVAEIKDMIFIELEVFELNMLITEVRKNEGSLAANLGLTDNGLPCVGPLQNLLKTKRAQWKSKRTALKDLLEENLAGEDVDDRLSELTKYKEQGDIEEEEEDDDDFEDDEDDDDDDEEEEK